MSFMHIPPFIVRCDFWYIIKCIHILLVFSHAPLTLKVVPPCLSLVRYNMHFPPKNLSINYDPPCSIFFHLCLSCFISLTFRTAFGMHTHYTIFSCHTSVHLISLSRACFITFYIAGGWTIKIRVFSWVS